MTATQSPMRSWLVLSDALVVSRAGHWWALGGASGEVDGHTQPHYHFGRSRTFTAPRPQATRRIRDFTSFSHRVSHGTAVPACSRPQRPLFPRQAMVLSISEFTVVEWLLAVSIAGTYIGHGSIALGGGEPKWYSYLAVAAIGPSVGRTLMPLIGALDVAVGFAALLYPHPFILAYAAVWGAATAIMRPLAGESVWAAVERTGNSLPAVALMWLVAERQQKGGGYYFGMVTIVLAMMLAAVTLLLRQTGFLAERRQGAVKVANKSK